MWREQMKRMTFQRQLCLGLILLFLGFICSSLFKVSIYSNIGAILYGLLFVINPVCPNKAKDVPRIRLYIRLTGVLLVILGVMTRYSL